MPRSRRPNPTRVKIHRNYDVNEVARLFGIHKNTVRNWIKQGLPVIDGSGPTLVHGLDMRAFLEQRRQKAKRPCPPGHLYCVKCRSPKIPAGQMVDYIASTETLGNLRGICPDCETLINRRVSFARLEAVCRDMDITFPVAGARIGERNFPSVDCDSSKESLDHENAQR